MIVNTRETCYVIVELDAEDVKKILKGEDIVVENCAADDDVNVLVRCYCSNPEDFKK
jgi:NOL1/NOP2/fmu family ribosome biogenesis protein